MYHCKGWQRFCLVVVLGFLFSATSLKAVKPTAVPPPPYTKSQIGTYLSKGWAGYKMKFILSNGRVIRPENNNDTVSEGQAYAMLLAVYLNDQATFDKCFQWTDQNLSRTQSGSAPYGGPDNLLAWHWDPTAGIQGHDWDAASDADGDYAFALILAYEKWGNTQYLAKAMAVMQDILAKETHSPANLANLLFLKPGNWGEDNIFGHQGIHINPSYFSPFWYRKFNLYMPDSRWQQLIDGCYQIIQTASLAILNPDSPDSFNGVGLMPDWAFVDESGIVYFRDDAFNNINTTISSWDAFRAPWRVYFDLNATAGSELRATNYLNQLASFYQQRFNTSNPIFASYYYSGVAAVNYTSPAASGVPLLASTLNYASSIDQQTGNLQTALAYILKSTPTNPPTNTRFSKGTADTFQDFGTYGYFVAPGDILRYYINSWCMLGLLVAYHTPEPQSY